jgi:hypothetical protein
MVISAREKKNMAASSDNYYAAIGFSIDINSRYSFFTFYLRFILK